MRADIGRRLKKLEASRPGQWRTAHEMPDRDLFQVLNVRHPMTGALRTDLTDDELRSIIEEDREAGGVQVHA